MYNKRRFPARPGFNPGKLPPHVAIKQAAQQVVNKSGFSKVNTAFPGQNMGLTFEEVQGLVENAVKAVGERFTTAGSVVSVKPQLPSTAKYILGFTFSQITNPDDQFTMLINNESVISNGSPIDFMHGNAAGNVSACAEPYIEFFRPVSGSTAITFDYISPSGGGDNVVITVYYV